MTSKTLVCKQSLYNACRFGPKCRHLHLVLVKPNEVCVHCIEGCCKFASCNKPFRTFNALIEAETNRSNEVNAKETTETNAMVTTPSVVLTYYVWILELFYQDNAHVIEERNGTKIRQPMHVLFRIGIFLKIITALGIPKKDYKEFPFLFHPICSDGHCPFYHHVNGCTNSKCENLHPSEANIWYFIFQKMYNRFGSESVNRFILELIVGPEVLDSDFKGAKMNV